MQQLLAMQMPFSCAHGPEQGNDKLQCYNNTLATQRKTEASIHAITQRKLNTDGNLFAALYAPKLQTHKNGCPMRCEKSESVINNATCRDEALRTQTQSKH